MSFAIDSQCTHFWRRLAGSEFLKVENDDTPGAHSATWKLQLMISAIAMHLTL